MDQIEIRRETHEGGGRYFATLAGLPQEAELAWVDLGPALIAANHTFVPETMRGSGIAAAMVDRLVADARAESFKIVPLCSYVQAQFARHPDWADLQTAL